MRKLGTFSAYFRVTTSIFTKTYFEEFHRSPPKLKVRAAISNLVCLKAVYPGYIHIFFIFLKMYCILYVVKIYQILFSSKYPSKSAYTTCADFLRLKNSYLTDCFNTYPPTFETKHNMHFWSFHAIYRNHQFSWIFKSALFVNMLKIHFLSINQSNLFTSNKKKNYNIYWQMILIEQKRWKIKNIIYIILWKQQLIGSKKWKISCLWWGNSQTKTETHD